MGIDCTLEPVFAFVYRAELGNGLTEHEYDHVFVGRHDGPPEPDPAEVAEWRWVAPRALLDDLAAEPGRFTPWLGIAIAEWRRRDPLRWARA
jgi:isopentenyl-diphosphate delta-isomerase